jgi:hypothetical protein
MKPTEPESIQKGIEQYRRAVQSGSVWDGYRALMNYLQKLRLSLSSCRPDYAVSAVQQGQMDYSYFTFTPKSLKQRNLKIVILFIHSSFSFEVWLSGQNKAAAIENLKQLKEQGWSKHETAANAQNADYITKACLVAEADFRCPEELMEQIKQAAFGFIGDVEGFLAPKR